MRLQVDAVYLPLPIQNQRSGILIIDAHLQRMRHGFLFNNLALFADVVFYDANGHQIGEPVQGDMIVIPENFLEGRTNYLHFSEAVADPGDKAVALLVMLGSLESPAVPIRRSSE